MRPFQSQRIKPLLNKASGASLLLNSLLWIFNNFLFVLSLGRAVNLKLNEGVFYSLCLQNLLCLPRFKKYPSSFGYWKRNQSNNKRNNILLSQILEKWYAKCMESIKCTTTQIGKMGERFV